MSKQLSVIDELKQTITTLKPQFKAALPKHVPVEKFTRVLMTAVSSNPQLAESNRNSLFSACMKLAQVGLMPDGQEAAIVTFRTKEGVMAKEMPMVKGVLKLVRNSGELATLSPHVVHANDEFKWWIDEDGEHFKHVPATKDRGEITHVYAMAKLKDNSVYLEVMSKEDIDKVRASSRAKDGAAWTDWYSEMGKKTVIRRLAKRLPLSSDLEAVVTGEDDLYEFKDSVVTEEIKDVTPKDTKLAKPSRLKDALKAKAEDKKVEKKEEKMVPPDMLDDEMPSFQEEEV